MKKSGKSQLNTAMRLLKIGGSLQTNYRIVLYCVISLIITLVGPALSYMGKELVNLLTVSYNVGNMDYIKKISLLIAITLVLSVFLIVLNKTKELFVIYINHETSKKINIHIHGKLHKIKYEHYEDANTYNIITRVIDNCPNIYSVLNAIISLIMAVISTVSYGILLGSIRWYFIFLILIPNFLYVVAETKNMFERYFLNIGQTNDNRKLRYIQSLFSDKKSNKEIRAFHLIDILTEKYEKIRNSLYKQGMRLLVKQSVISFSLLMISRIGLIICLIIVCSACVDKEASIGDISLVLSAGLAFGESFVGVFSQANFVTKKAVYLNDWLTFEQMKTEDGDSEKVDEVETIRFVDVSYKYPSSERYALKNISCEIQKGKTIALVGENGSGKTTFAKLLLGALTPESGYIAINETDLSKILHGFRKIISYIPQNYGTFKLTLADNLVLGNNRVSLETYKPKFINFFNKLPQGNDTPLGNVFPNGVDLSGGEWQRISIERALLREQSQIYVMDEPAASLDPITESELYEHFTRELKGKTNIITSHRLGACSLADYIFVFDHGEIIEEGPHDFLMSLKGKYYDMYTAQRSLYERNTDNAQV